MTLIEARKVAKILQQADGGCADCVSHLAAEAAVAFPQFKWSYPIDCDEIIVTKKTKK